MALQTRTFEGLEIPLAGTFGFDHGHTVIGASARHLMVTKVRGNFTEYEGAITFAENPLESSVEVTIQAASVTTGNEQRDGHLKSPDFLDVENFPTLSFKSSRVAKVDGNELVLVGDLTIRGVTREIELDVEYHGVNVAPWGSEVVGFSATYELDREEFGMTWNAALETGGVVVGKKIKVELEVEAVRA